MDQNPVGISTIPVHGMHSIKTMKYPDAKIKHSIPVLVLLWLTKWVYEVSPVEILVKHEFSLVREQSRLCASKYYFSRKAIHAWNNYILNRTL